LGEHGGQRTNLLSPLLLVLLELLGGLSELLLLLGRVHLLVVVVLGVNVGGDGVEGLLHGVGVLGDGSSRLKHNSSERDS
jgi:hypothetical protein